MSLKSKLPRYLTRQSPPDKLEDYKNGFDANSEHESGPGGCHPDCQACFHEEQFDDATAWKLDVGAECNRLLQLADVEEAASEMRGSEKPMQSVLDIRSLVARVASFEELEEEV